MNTIFLLVKEERPFQFFALSAAVLAGTSVVLAWPLFTTYLATGLVPRVPTVVLVMGLMLLAFLSFVAGLVLDIVTLGRRELKRLHYLGLRGPSTAERRLLAKRGPLDRRA